MNCHNCLHFFRNLFKDPTVKPFGNTLHEIMGYKCKPSRSTSYIPRLNVGRIRMFTQFIETSRQTFFDIPVNEESCFFPWLEPLIEPLIIDISLLIAPVFSPSSLSIITYYTIISIVYVVSYLVR